MPSVFKSEQRYENGFRADKLKMTINGDPVDGLVIQNVQFSFTQQITMLYEIGTRQQNVYYVGGRAQGTATIARILGPGPGSQKFIKQYNDLCDPKPISFNGSSACKGNGTKYTMKWAVLTTVAVSVNANDIVINEQLQFMFIDLVYK